MEYDKEIYKEEFNKLLKERNIKKSDQRFKIKLFIQKAENSLQIAKFHKNINPKEGQPNRLYWNYWAITIAYYSMLYAAKAAILSKGYSVENHYSAQIALGHLLVPSEIEKEDLELLDKSYKIFEDEYVKYFEEARKESRIARYAAHKSYTERKVEEIYDNARKFISKIVLVLEDEV